MHRITHYFRTNVGRRGAVLLLFAALGIVFGLKGLVDPTLDHGEFLVYRTLPGAARALIWIPVSVYAGYTALRKKPKNDALGFGALVFPVSVLFMSYIGSFIAFLTGYTMYSTGWIDALEWLLLILLLYITSGWVEVDAPDDDEKGQS